MLHRLLLGAAVAAALAPTATAHAAESPFEDRSFRVEVTGIHVTDWAYSHDPFSDDDGYTRGSGTETVGWHTPRAGRLGARRWVVRTLPGLGERMPAFQLLGLDRLPTVKATVKRTSRIDHLGRRPVCEGSQYDDECLVVPLPGRVPQQCGRRPLQAQVSLDLDGDRETGLAVTTALSTADAYGRCAPDGGDRSSFTGDLPAPPEIAFSEAAARLAGAARGETTTFHREVRSEGCPLRTPTGTEGYRSCSTTDVTVEVTRTR